MPLARVGYPSLALSLLKPLVEREGVSCDVSYLNIAFQTYTGRPDTCEEVSRYFIVGEWLFGEELFGDEWARSDRGRLDVSRLSDRTEPRAIQDSLTSLRPMAKPFIRECMDMVNWNDYSIIGFTSIFEQQVASLALARRIKERWPEKIIAFGGANCDEGMGIALLRLFPFVDWVFSGEADLSFPQAVTQWFAGRPPEGIPGVAYRRDGQIMVQGSGQPPELDSLPYPDFDDYFAALRKWAPADLPSAHISLELSRGCWWGEKHQCIFCGFNRRTSLFRHKSPQRALDEIKAVTTRFGVSKVMLTDAILDMGFFKTLLPALSNLRLEELFLETKANLSREQVRILKSAGVKEIQPGIESLDTEILAYMRKGTTLLQNVQLLKWAREYGMNYAGWNILCGFPGENPEAYRGMAWLIPSLVHLSPPISVLPFLLQRFSPLFERSREWGLKNIRAHARYRSVYPFAQEDLDELAYIFDYDFDGKADIPTYIAPVEEEVRAWRQSREHRQLPVLAFERQPGGKVVIHDTRPCRTASRVELEGEMAIAYLACDARRQFDSLATEVREQRGKEYSGDAELRRCLDELVARRLMLRDGNWYLSLANDLGIMKEHGGSVLAYLLASKT